MIFVTILLVSFELKKNAHLPTSEFGNLNSDDGENPDLEMGTKNVTVFKPVNGVVGLWCLVPLSTIFQLCRGKRICVFVLFISALH
jgi:hypothetical protein